MTDSAEQRWYVVQTQVNREARAAEHLCRQGYEVYLPRYMKRRRHARKIDFIPRPLFPRYMFVAIDMASQRWRSIQSTFGVSRLVCNGEDPAQVPTGVVSGLMAREDDKGYVKMEMRPVYVIGQKVLVLAGVFSQNLGLFDGMADRDRIAILLDLLGRKVRVSIEADLVAAA